MNIVRTKSCETADESSREGRSCSGETEARRQEERGAKERRGHDEGTRAASERHHQELKNRINRDEQLRQNIIESKAYYC